jgi:O-antigen/teichoic acid export membrane protein
MDKSKILKALSWNFIGVYGNQAVLFVVGIILARLLEPEDFGLIAMILVFYNFGQIFVDLGFNNAIIQRKTNTREDLSTLFYVNLIFGVVLFGLLFFSSDMIARFYQKAELVEITRVIALIFIFFALSSIQRTLVIKEMNFKFESMVILISSMVSGIIAIFLAFKGFGVWALVLKVVLQRLFETILFWMKRKWRPIPVFRLDSIKKYLGFSLNITAATILNGISQNIDKLIIGKIFSAQSLGFFDRAKKYNNLAQSNIALIFGKVMYPVFSEIQDDTERFNRIYNKTIQMISFFTLPLFFHPDCGGQTSDRGIDHR